MGCSRTENSHPWLFRRFSFSGTNESKNKHSHTYTHMHPYSRPILIWFLPKAWSRRSTVWVLFSTVTGGWDNGAQLNCARLIYFYLRKQIGCTSWEGGLNLETSQKGPQRKAARRNPISLNSVYYSLNYWDPFPSPHHLENALLLSFNASYVVLSLRKQTNKVLDKKKITKGVGNLYHYVRKNNWIESLCWIHSN